MEAKTRKLRKVWTKLQTAKQEIRDITTEFQEEKEGLLETIRELTKALKLKQTVIAEFIPPHRADMVSPPTHTYTHTVSGMIHPIGAHSLPRPLRSRRARCGTRSRRSGACSGPT